MIQNTNTANRLADLLALIDAYAEARHVQGHSSYNAQTATALQAVVRHPACSPDMLVNGGALKLALNVLRRAGKNEIADELEATAQPAAQCFDAADMATAAAQGFRDGAASVSAGSEPAPENIRGILARCRDFIDTAKVPAYPAGADLADEIDALLAAQVVVPTDLITIRKPTTSAVLAKWGTPATGGEPAGTVGYTVHGTQYVNWRTKPPAHGTPLYTTPQPTQAQADGFFLMLPQRPKPEAPSGTAGLDWDAYSGTQMLAFGRDCSDAAIAALRTEQPAPSAQQAGARLRIPPKRSS